MPDFDLDVFKEKAEKHLDETSDLTLVVLKGNLLVEEALYTALKRHCRNPAFLERADLRLYQMIFLARALISPNNAERAAQEEKIWDAMLALNSLRNKLAHILEPEAIAPLLQRLQINVAGGADLLNDKDIVRQLSISVSMIVGWALGIAERPLL